MAATGKDDFALGRVPLTARRSWFGMAVQRFGMLSALPQFLLGSVLGFGMTFWGAFWALTLGAIIIEVISIMVGIIGAREGLSSTMLARWTGFGSKGAALVALMVGLSVTGWFGVQTGVSAQGLAALFGGLPVWVWALLFGVAVTAIVLYGIGSMAWTAYLAVPAFMILVAWSIGTELSRHSLSSLISSPAPGPPMTLAQGTTVVAGTLLVGAVVTCDMTRFNRNAADVVKQTVVGITLGEYVIGLSGVLLAHAVGEGDVIAIIVSSVGWVGILVTVLGTVKINDWNLYSAGLAVVTFIEVLTGRRPHRGVVTIALGALGSAAAAAGLLGWFTVFSTVLAFVFPPIAAIMVAEYIVVKRWRGLLDESRATGTVPASAPGWVPASLVIWAAAAAAGGLLGWGSPSITSFVTAFVLYVVAGKLGLVREVGRRSLTSPAPDTEPVASR